VLNVVGSYFVSCVDSTGPAEQNRLHPPGIDQIDGSYSVGQHIALFSDTRPAASRAPGEVGATGGLRAALLHSRCLHGAEVAELAAAMKRESQEGVVQQIVTHLMMMGVDAQIARWAATSSEGATVDARINSALNIVYS